MIKHIKKSERKCKEVLDVDWKTLDQMSDEWGKPKDVEYDGEHLYIHGVNIRLEIQSSMQGYLVGDFILVGEELGKASLLLH